MTLETIAVAMASFLSTPHAWWLVLPGTAISCGIVCTATRLGLISSLHWLAWAVLVASTVALSRYEFTPGGVGLRSWPLVAVACVVCLPFLRRVGAAVAASATFLSALCVDLVMNWAHLGGGIVTPQNVMSSIGAGGWLERLWLDPLVVTVAALALGAGRAQVDWDSRR